MRRNTKFQRGRLPSIKSSNDRRKGKFFSALEQVLQSSSVQSRTSNTKESTIPCQLTLNFKLGPFPTKSEINCWTSKKEEVRIDSIGSCVSNDGHPLQFIQIIDSAIMMYV